MSDVGSGVVDIGTQVCFGSAKKKIESDEDETRGREDRARSETVAAVHGDVWYASRARVLRCPLARVVPF